MGRVGRTEGWFANGTGADTGVKGHYYCGGVGDWM